MIHAKNEKLGQKMNTKEYHLGRLLQKVGSYDANFRDTLQCICKILLLRKAHGEGAFVGQHANEACESINLYHKHGQHRRTVDEKNRKDGKNDQVISSDSVEYHLSIFAFKVARDGKGW